MKINSIVFNDGTIREISSDESVAIDSIRVFKEDTMLYAVFPWIHIYNDTKHISMINMFSVREIILDKVEKEDA